MHLSLANYRGEPELSIFGYRVGIQDVHFVYQQQCEHIKSFNILPTTNLFFKNQGSNNPHQ